MTERLLTWPELAELVPYSRDHISRLERAGEFTQRLQIGKARVAWRASEVTAWLASRGRGPLPITVRHPERADARRVGRALSGIIGR